MNGPALGGSWLYVPGNRPDRFDKAAASGASAVICDLEDAVPADEKAAARDEVIAWLDRHRAFVRVNGADTVWHHDDLAAVASAPGAVAVVLPKSQTPDQVGQVAHQLGERIGVVPLIESACGVANVAEIAAAPRVLTLAFGSIDFGLDIGVDGAEGEDDSPLLHARSAIVLAARVADIAAPIDGVTVALSDANRIRRDARRSVALGFGGKQCIHPGQVGVVNDVFTPSGEALEWARLVVEAADAAGGSAVQVDGQMIDTPRIEQARRLLASSPRHGGRV